MGEVRGGKSWKNTLKLLLMKFFRCMLPLLAVLLGAVAQAQNSIDVKAVLIDSKTEEPVGFATVSLTREGQERPAKYTLSDDKGNVTLASVRRGTYTFKAELLGYKTYTAEVKVTDSTVDLGTVKLRPDTEQIDAATVSAVGNTVVIKKDTIEYNATAFNTTDNDVLEDLLKKLPGVEVSEDGSITANGETISKITIDGKTFFLDDPQLASKNIPAKMINRLKIIQKKSEQAEFTGIDDGEEETVIDLSVQPGMMKGLFGNVLAGAGADLPSTDGTPSDLRYQGNAFIGRFTDKSQISLILNGNNVNNQGGTNRSGNMMMNMRLKDNQKLAVRERGFYYYLQQGRAKKAKDMLDAVRSLHADRAKDLEIQYSILIKKESKYIKEVQEKIDHLWDGKSALDEDKMMVVGTFEYLLGLQYSYLNDIENMKKVFTSALKHCAGTPYEDSIKQIMEQKA